VQPLFARRRTAAELTVSFENLRGESNMSEKMITCLWFDHGKAREAQGLAFEEGVSIAFRQRNGRNPVDGDTITPEDDVRAGQIATALLKPGGIVH
jgi:hypothetical protein